MAEAAAGSGSEAVRLSALKRVISACEAFEAAWKTGDPRIEDFLPPQDDPLHGPIFHELLALELEIRSARGERPERGAYSARFPNLVDAIVDVFSEVFASPGGDQSTILHGKKGRDAASPGEGGDRYVDRRRFKEGGLGVIYKARDVELNREIALKMIRPRYAADPQTRARFLVEAEVTARLDHPGIVPIHSLGRDPDGSPFYAMKLINGKGFEEVIKDHFNGAKEDAPRESASLRALVRHFLDVCRAVAYAHDRKVLHRDLKPANIMIGSFGETYTLDWGLMKVVGRSVETEEAVRPANESTPSLVPEAGGAVDPTQQGSVLGTYGFMSPEQAAGDVAGLTKASDVYSLGAVLYALLTNRPPFSGDREEITKDILAGRFSKPREIRPSAPPPLETICLKAMALRPEDRHPSALALAADVSRWLDDEPVPGHRDPKLVRLARWTRRHPSLASGGATALAATVLGLAAAAAGFALHDRSVARERDRAEANFRTGHEAISGMLAELAQGRYGRGSQIEDLRRGLTDVALSGYEKVHAGNPDKPEAIAAMASIDHAAANVARTSGLDDKARKLYARAIALWEDRLAPAPNDRRARRELAQALIDLGELDRMCGRYEDAEGGYMRALNLVSAPGVGGTADMEIRAMAAINLGESAYETGRFDESASRSEEAVALLTPFAGDAGRPSAAAVLLLLARFNLGTARRDAGDRDGAELTLGDAVRQARALAGATRHRDVSYLFAVAQTQWAEHLAADPLRRDKAADALDDAVKRLTILTRSYDAWLDDEALASALTAQGEAWLKAGDLDKAGAAGASARKRLEDVLRRPPARPSTRSELGRTLALLGRTAEARGKRKEAVGLLEQAVAQHRGVLKIAPNRHPDSLLAPRLEADLERLRGKLDQPRPSTDGKDLLGAGSMESAQGSSPSS